MLEDEDKAWIDQRENLFEVYDDYNYSSRLQSFVMKASHKLSEKVFGENIHFDRVLEIGAGTGEHLPYVRHTFDEYILTDLNAEILAVAKNKLSVSNYGALKFEQQSADSLSYSDNTFDRVVAVHVLEHISEPHIALKEWSRVLKNNGVLTILIPADPGLAWKLGRHLGPRRKAVAKGVPYDYLMAREHVNSCNNLIAILHYYFPESTDSWWPLPIASVDLNLFYVFHTVVNKLK